MFINIPHNQIYNYFAESTTLFDQNNTRLYSLDNGKKIKTLNNAFPFPVYDLINWYNKENDEYYIIEIGLDSIVITNLLLEDEVYYKYKINDKHIYHKGVLYESDEGDYLCSISLKTQIIIIELYTLTVIKKLLIPRPNIDLYAPINEFILWNNKYIIINYKNIPLCFIFDLENDKIISKFIISSTSSNSSIFIKKIYHSTYGESLLIGKNKNIIELWSI